MSDLSSPCIPHFLAPAALLSLLLFFRGLQWTLTCTKSFLNVCEIPVSVFASVFSFFFCECHVRVCCRVILRSVAQEQLSSARSILSKSPVIQHFSHLWKLSTKSKPPAANCGGLFEWRQMNQSGLTVSHRHPQTCLSLPLNPGVHLSVECKVLGSSWANNPGYESTRPPHIHIYTEDGKHTGWTDTEHCWAESHGLNEDCVYTIVEICGGTVQISLFVQAVQTEAHAHRGFGFKVLIVLMVPVSWRWWCDGMLTLCNGSTKICRS